jgi:HEAT repeat protein
VVTGAAFDPDAGVRQCAALGLRQQPDAQAVPSLVEALHDRDPLVARLAGEALAAAGEQAVPRLIEVLQHDSQALANAGPHARREAARALAAIGDPRAVPALYEVLDDDSALLVYWAEQGLERMGVGMAFFKP